MSRKIPIRRIGSHVPTICLVGFLFFCIAVVWLSTAGLPESVLRQIEKMAAERGVYLSLDKLKLAPYRGLAIRAKGIRIRAAQGDSTPLLTADSATASVGLFRLFDDCPLRTVELKRGHIALPVEGTPGEVLEVDIPIIHVGFGKKEFELKSVGLNVEGIGIRVSGTISKPELSIPEQSDSAPHDQQFRLDIPALLAEYAPVIEQVHREISRQNWDAQTAPDFRLHLTTDNPIHANLTADIPTFRYDVFQFRNAKADIELKNEQLTINMLSFDTVDPPSSAFLKGAYDSKNGTVGFDFDSTAALIPIANQILGRENAGLLNKLTHAPDKSPHIVLRGNAQLNKDYTLNHLTLNGEIEQEMLLVEDFCIDRLTLGFFYSDGNFNINSAFINYGNSRVRLTANVNKGMGHATLRANVHVEDTLQLINKFTSEPFSLPENISTGESVQLHLTTELTTPDFTPGSTDWQNFTPSVTNLELTAETDRLQVEDYQLSSPKLQVALQNIRQDAEMVPLAADTATFSLSAAEIKKTDTLQLIAPGLLVKATGLKREGNELVLATLDIEPSEQKLTQYLSVAGVEMSNVCGGYHAKDVQLSKNGVTVGASDGELSCSRFLNNGLEAGQTTLLLNALQINKNEPAGLSLCIETGNVQYRECSLGNLRAALTLDQSRQGNASLEWAPAPATETIPHYVSFRTNLELQTPELLTCRQAQLTAAPAAFVDVLQHFGVTIPQIQVPEHLSAQGDFTYNWKDNCPETAAIHLDIPKLVRTPGMVKSFKGKKIELGISSDIELNRASEEETTYRAQLEVTHGEERFSGVINGTTAGRLTVEGTNTIRTDVVDALIDHPKAHNIMRDFAFRQDSKNIITNIRTTVDYSQGVMVDSYCDVELVNVAYQLNAIQEDEQGNEYPRTDLGGEPFTWAKHATCYVRTVVNYPHAADAKEECAVTIGNITMTFDNQPWFRRQNFKDCGISEPALQKVLSKNTNTTMTGDAVIIDIENSFVELVNIKGTIYPAYSLGMYYAPLQHFMEDIALPYPAYVETKSCVFPIFSDCKRPMSGLIKASAPNRAGFRFLGTTIPMDNFNGFIHLTDNYVLLDQMNANTWEGVLRATVKIDFSGERTAFDGMVTAANMNLSDICAAYGAKYSKALCQGNLRFRSPTPDLKSLQAYGSVSIANGNLMEFSLFQPVASLVTDLPAKLLMLDKAAKTEGADQESGYIATALSGTANAITNIGNQARLIPGYNHIFAYDLQNAKADFAIADGKLRAYNMSADGYNLDVDMKFSVDLENGYILGNIWPKISSLPTIVLSPVTFLSDFMIDIIVYGTPDELKWKFGLDRNLRGKNKKKEDSKKQSRG